MKGVEVLLARQFSDPSIPRMQFDQLQEDKAHTIAQIRSALERLGERHSIPASYVKDLEAEIASEVENLTYEAEFEYRQDLEVRLDCIESDSETEGIVRPLECSQN